MIGHYLLSLTSDEEGLILTTALGANPTYFAEGCPSCLVGAVLNGDGCARAIYNNQAYKEAAVIGRSGPEIRFDDLCRRFGDVRVNAAIRNRILSNRARRLLAGIQDLQSVGAET